MTRLKALLIVLALVAAGAAYYFYENGFAFSQSEAAGYPISATHVTGPRAVVRGETVRLKWDSGFASQTNPVNIEIVAPCPIQPAGSAPCFSYDTLVQNYTKNTYDWYVSDPKAGNIVGRTAYIRVFQPNTLNELESEMFNVVEPLRPPSSSQGSMRIISPNGGEQLILNTPYIIRWESNQKAQDHISVTLVVKDPTTGRTERHGIVTVPDTGSYSWIVGSGSLEIANAIAPGKQYKISVAGGVGTGVDESDGYFTITERRRCLWGYCF